MEVEHMLCECFAGDRQKACRRWIAFDLIAWENGALWKSAAFRKRLLNNGLYGRRWPRVKWLLIDWQQSRSENIIWPIIIIGLFFNFFSARLKLRNQPFFRLTASNLTIHRRTIRFQCDHLGIFSLKILLKTFVKFSFWKFPSFFMALHNSDKNWISCERFSHRIARKRGPAFGVGQSGFCKTRRAEFVRNESFSVKFRQTGTNSRICFGIRCCLGLKRRPHWWGFTKQF